MESVSVGIVGMVQRAGLSVGRDRERWCGGEGLGLSICYRYAVLNAAPLRRNNLDPLCEAQPGGFAGPEVFGWVTPWWRGQVYLYYLFNLDIYHVYLYHVITF